jgi:hypothetical protein
VMEAACENGRYQWERKLALMMLK